MSEQPESHPINIFEVLPNELIGEILSHVNSIELIFSYSRVCKYWRSLCQNLIWQDYEKTLLKFKLISNTTNRDEQHHLNMFFTESPSGRKFIKYLLRKQVFELACKLSKIETQPVDDNQRSIRVHAQWVDTELAILKGYFNNFCNFADLSTILPKPTIKQPTSTTTGSTQQQQKGFFASAFSFIGSMFSTNPNSSSQQQQVAAEKKPLEYNYITKVVLDGYCGAGKTCLLQCAMNNTPLIDPNAFNSTIGVDFSIRTFVFSETTRVKLQLWDHSGPERYRSITSAYYRGASVVIFLVDPYCNNSCFELDMKKDEILKHAPKAEVIFITTKKDLQEKQKRIITNDEADVFAFENFGAIHLDITNTKVDEPKCIVWYCALMKYLLNAQSPPP